MLIFLSLTVAGLVLLLGGAIFGHDHDVDHDHDAHVDAGHDVDQGGEPTVSVFSVKVIGTFIMGFGAGGAIASYYHAGPLQASAAGFVTGLLLGAAMYLVMRLIYGQQASSLVATESLKGQTGTVTAGIEKDAVGEVTVLSRPYLARSKDGKPIKRGQTVSVVATVGSELIVSEQN